MVVSRRETDWSPGGRQMLSPGGRLMLSPGGRQMLSPGGRHRLSPGGRQMLSPGGRQIGLPEGDKGCLPEGDKCCLPEGDKGCTLLVYTLPITVGVRILANDKNFPGSCSKRNGVYTFSIHRSHYCGCKNLRK